MYWDFYIHIVSFCPYKDLEVRYYYPQFIEKEDSARPSYFCSIMQ